MDTVIYIVLFYSAIICSHESPYRLSISTETGLNVFNIEKRVVDTMRDCSILSFLMHEISSAVHKDGKQWSGP